MLRHSSYPRAYDFWGWSPLLSFRDLDTDMRRLMDMVWGVHGGSYCDNNGVLTMTPSYRVHSVDRDVEGGEGDNDNEHMTRIEVDIPGVKKDGVAIDAIGNRLKIVAAKYSADGRSKWCKKHRRRSSKKGGEEEGDDDETGNEKLPSIVYKLHLRLSGKADLDAVNATYRGDGILRIHVPHKAVQSRKISVNSE